jgi:hypothetical protein
MGLKLENRTTALQALMYSLKGLNLHLQKKILLLIYKSVRLKT